MLDISYMDIEEAHSSGSLSARSYSARRRSSASVSSAGVASSSLGLQPLSRERCGKSFGTLGLIAAHPIRRLRDVTVAGDKELLWLKVDEVADHIWRGR